MVNLQSGVSKFAQLEVSFQWKNPDFLLRNPDFLCVLKNGWFYNQKKTGRGKWDGRLGGEPFLDLSIAGMFY